jgi:TolB-like protein
MADSLRDQLQQTLAGTHTLERELGGGGMSKVFVAEETRLRRKVVVKVLSPELAQGLSVERFEREIQTAAALQQANIVPVLSAGDTNGLPFYTMPFVEGESLRARLGRGPLGVTEVISVLRDVARALAYAHRQGVVHRDIKPDNVLLSEGAAVVTDFGIAKAISAARSQTAGATLTQVGTSIGTPAYMAPEQAAGDPQIDHRADIYSLGAMAYELLSGQVVFANRTPQRMLAAHMSESPKSISDLRPDTPQALGELVMRCLAKEPGDRPQDGNEVLRNLESTSGSGMPAMPPVLMGGPGAFKKALAIYAAAFVVVAIVAKAAIVGIGLPDWVFPGSLIVMALGLPVILWTGYVQGVTRRAMAATPAFTPGGTPAMKAQSTIATMALKAAPHVSWYKTARGGMYAFGGFIAIVGVFMAMRAFGIGPFGSLMASGKFGAKEKVILAEFKSPAGDSLLGPTVTEAFRTDIGQSVNLSVVPALTVRSALQRMQKPANSRLDFALAREVASRDGVKAVIDGEVVALGGSYVLSVRLISTQSGEELAAFRETAADQRDIIPAISRVSKALRTRIGESLRRVQNTKSLDKVSTASMEALQKYVAGSRADYEEGDFEKARQLLEEAIALDTGFAMAYRRLGVILNNRGIERDRVVLYATKAYEHRDRLSDVERQNAIAFYYRSGPVVDRAKQIAAYEAALAIDSNDIASSSNLAQEYEYRREYAKQELLVRRALTVDSTTFQLHANLLRSLVHQGKVSDAEQAAQVMMRDLPRNPNSALGMANVRFAKNDLDGYLSIADSLRKARAGDDQTQVSAAGGFASVALLRGQLASASKYREEVQRRNQAAGNKQEALVAALDEVDLRVRVLGDVSGAARILDKAVAANAIDAIPLVSRPYIRLARAYAEVGRIDAAQATLKRADAAGFLARLDRADAEASRRTVLADIAMAEKQFADAAREYRAGDIGTCSACVMPNIAAAFDHAGQADSAIFYLNAYATAPSENGNVSAIYLPSSHERLGQLYEAKGNATKAAEHYQQFIDLWKNADPELQPRVAAARERLKKLAPVEKPR